MNSRDVTRRITYSAVCVAISAVAVLLSQLSPARIVPLVLCSLCFYIAFVRCGVLYGVITAAATMVICFFISGINATFLFLCIVFAPYSALAFLMRKLSYRVTKQLIIRLVVATLFFAVAFVVLMLLFDKLAGTSLTALIDKLGKPLAGVMVVIAVLPVDLFFSYAAEKILKALK